MGERDRLSYTQIPRVCGLCGVCLLNTSSTRRKQTYRVHLLYLNHVSSLLLWHFSCREKYGAPALRARGVVRGDGRSKPVILLFPVHAHRASNGRFSDGRAAIPWRWAWECFSLRTRSCGLCSSRSDSQNALQSKVRRESSPVVLVDGEKHASENAATLITELPRLSVSNYIS